MSISGPGGGAGYMFIVSEDGVEVVDPEGRTVVEQPTSIRGAGLLGVLDGERTACLMESTGSHVKVILADDEARVAVFVGSAAARDNLKRQLRMILRTL